MSRLSPQQLAIAASALGYRKQSAVPVEEIAPPDPAAGGAPPPGAPPMDPAMMGGPPMDPAMMGAPPMDPAMGGAPPEPDPLIEMLEQMAKDVAQTKSLVATLVDQMGIKIPTKEILASGEDAVAETAMKASQLRVDGYIPAASDTVNTNGHAAQLPLDAVDYAKKSMSLDSSLQYAAAIFRSRKD